MRAQTAMPSLNPRQSIVTNNDHLQGPVLEVRIRLSVPFTAAAYNRSHFFHRGDL